ncbi:hypothetical protein NBRC110019_05140 [Neptunitalea chrysea]|uniref:T9SS type A sorting domain-containing protein n=1 Tax=Neptunitalea chrysea TaxID=1647581 RepID=A0A9W6B392_9FLAO|nr:T9SS type A sorting domain-containing protein [Neptunitalea chrysea]GLB51475.1 hypothetical protein NBRC110019_05140 [Neptunitalea chrysea]
MKLKLLLTLFCLLGILFKNHANNDKYRLILVDDPSTTITVAWNQISGSSPVVYYDTTDHGTNYAMYASSKTVDRTTNFRGMSNQFARLINLTPNTAYYFVIHDSEGTSQRFWFKTAPDDNSRLSFIAGGDSRNNAVPRQKANTLVSKLKPHAVFFGGDMTDDDSNTEWQNWFDDWQLTIAGDGRMFPIVPARGNHESSSTIYNLFDTPNANSYYALTWGNNLIRTYTLNSEVSVLGDQLTWLQNDLTASSGLTWKMAQYHKPMRPHTSSKSEGNSEYNAWAQLFYDEEVRLVVDCDSHMAKTTWPVKPSSDPGNDEGFVIEEQHGTVYTGEGCWGAPLRPNDDDKSWTRSSGSFNQFKLVFVDDQKIELRTIDVNNAYSVSEGSNTDPFVLPANLNVFSPPTGAVVIISNGVANNPCDIVGTTCDDSDSTTTNEEEDGFCNCNGLLANDLVEETIAVATSSDDAEEEIASGIVDITSSDLELIYDGQDQLVGVRFDNVQMPQGATLYRAYIQFTTDETDNDQDPTSVTIEGELTTASATFAETINNISSRIRTTNSVIWNNIAEWGVVGESDLNQRTPYVTSIVSEITSQSGWTSGNAITFIFSGSGKRVAEAFDGTASPVLKLFYQTPCDPAGTTCDDGDPNTYMDIEDGNCNCIGIQETDTLTYQVNDGDNDAEEAETGGAMYLNSSDLELVYDSYAGQNNQTVGIRFTDIQIPQGAVILNAYIQFTVDETDSGTTNLQIRGEKVANSAIFMDTDFNITSRITTSTVVSWLNVPEWNSVGSATEDQRTPELRTVVQEIIDQAGWQPFNAMSFIITGTGSRAAESYNGSSGSAPKLVINYTLNDNCPEYGTLCDDGDATTINDEEDGFCNCAGVPADVVEDTDYVLTSSDDAEEEVSTGAIDLTSSDLELIYDGGSQLVGVRFDNVQIPDGATLYRAYIQFQTDETDSEEDPTNLVIHGELSSSSSTFTSASGDISSRPLTTTSVSWNEIPLWDTVGEVGIHQRTPYVTGIVEEVIAQSGWASGNAITFIFSGSGKRVAESKDGSAAPILKLFYQTPCNPAGTLCDDGDATTSFDIEDGNCNCAGIPETGTLTYEVNRSDNDAEEEVSNGSMDLTSSDLELVEEGGSTNQLVGIRFTDIQLPATAYITNAYIQFTVDDDNTGTTNLEIRAEATANSLEFSSADFDISSRTMGGSVVSWNNVPAWNTSDIGAAGTDQRTADISILVEEILSQSGWDLLHPMTFVITGSGEREAESFDGTAAPQLVIEYSLVPLSVDDNESVNNIKVYPNPVNDRMYVKSAEKITSVSIYSVTGQQVIAKVVDSNELTINMSELKSGVYFMHLLQSGKEYVHKIIVQ